MKRAIYVLAGMAAMAAIGVGIASATTRSYPTTITHDGTVDLGGGTFLVSGHIDSSRTLCGLIRVVTLKAHYPGGRVTQLDTDLTSGQGAWATRVNLTGADRVKAKVVKLLADFAVAAPLSKHGHHHRRVVCRAASVVFAAP